MRALVLRGSELRVDEVAEPPLPPGHVLLETIACGICGTDLHCRHHGASFVAAAQRSGLRMFDFDPGADLVMGHELSGRVLACGEGVDDLPAGTVVAVHPLVRDAERAHALGFSNVWPGGYAERVVVHAGGVVPLPAGTDPEHAALTEPLAVGLHAVNQSRAVERGSAIVVGCGPVGIAVIAALRIQGVPLVVAADLSAARRRVAEQSGRAPGRRPAGAHGGRGVACGRRSWPAVLFEAVGVPGRLDALMREAPSRSQIVVVGVCMEPDRIEPSIGVMKQQTISFALGWTAEEFRDSLDAIGRGDVDAGALITGRVGLEGAAAAFDELGRPEHHVKILVLPGRQPVARHAAGQARRSTTATRLLKRSRAARSS